MRLRPNTIDRNTLSLPLFDLAHERRQLRPLRTIQAVVVDVQFRIRVSLPRRPESNSHELFAQHG
jgi:hypothetical protein